MLIENCQIILAIATCRDRQNKSKKKLVEAFSRIMSGCQTRTTIFWIKRRSIDWPSKNPKSSHFKSIKTFLMGWITTSGSMKTVWGQTTRKRGTHLRFNLTRILMKLLTRRCLKPSGSMRIRFCKVISFLARMIGSWIRSTSSSSLKWFRISKK